MKERSDRRWRNRSSQHAEDDGPGARHGNRLVDYEFPTRSTHGRNLASPERARARHALAAVMMRVPARQWGPAARIGDARHTTVDLPERRPPSLSPSSSRPCRQPYDDRQAAEQDDRHAPPRVRDISKDQGRETQACPCGAEDVDDLLLTLSRLEALRHVDRVPAGCQRECTERQFCAAWVPIRLSQGARFGEVRRGTTERGAVPNATISPSPTNSAPPIVIAAIGMNNRPSTTAESPTTSPTHAAVRFIRLPGQRRRAPRHIARTRATERQIGIRAPPSVGTAPSDFGSSLGPSDRVLESVGRRRRVVGALAGHDEHRRRRVVDQGPRIGTCRRSRRLATGRQVPETLRYQGRP